MLPNLLVSQFLTIPQPNVCVLLDVGTMPGPNSIYHLWKAFDINSTSAVHEAKSSYQLYSLIFSWFSLVSSLFFMPDFTVLSPPRIVRCLTISMQLAWSMRGILLDWLVQLHARFASRDAIPLREHNRRILVCPSRLPRKITACWYYLSLCCLQGRRDVAPSVSHLLHCADSSYTESKILLAERYVLKTIDWNLRREGRCSSGPFHA